MLDCLACALNRPCDTAGQHRHLKVIKLLSRAGNTIGKPVDNALHADKIVAVHVQLSNDYAPFEIGSRVIARKFLHKSMKCRRANGVSIVPSNRWTIRLGAFDGVPGDPDRPKAFAAERLGKNYGLLTILQTDYKLSKDSQVEAGVAVQRERPRDRRGQHS